MNHYIATPVYGICGQAGVEPRLRQFGFVSARNSVFLGSPLTVIFATLNGTRRRRNAQAVRRIARLFLVTIYLSEREGWSRRGPFSCRKGRWFIPGRKRVRRVAQEVRFELYRRSKRRQRCVLRPIQDVPLELRGKVIEPAPRSDR